MSLTASGRAGLAIALAATVAVTVNAQRNRPTDARDRDDRSDDRNAVTETVNKTVALPANGRLKLRTFSGYVHITGTNSRDVTIKAVRKADRDVLDHVRLTIDASGSTVSIQANDKDSNWDRNRRNGDNGDIVRTDFDIELPASASLDINGFSSPLEISGVGGDQRLETFNGKITVTSAKGAIDAHTFNGAIDVDLTGAGSRPELTAHTFSASIRARIADSAHADVSFSSFSGQFDSDMPITMRSSRSGKVSGRVGSESGRSSTSGRSSSSSNSSSGAGLKFDTFSGDVHVVR
jgi:DUF4097 and DUF4098 domain-containing protein YvlB